MRVKELKNIKERVSLKDFNTYRVGGDAAYFLEARDRVALIGAVGAALADGMPYALLGGGTNTLVADEGFDGLVVKVAHQNIEVRGDAIYADAGVSMGALVQSALSGAFSGLEWASGLPGTLGGAIYGNAGSCGSETKNVVESVEVFDITTQKIKIYSNAQCGFAYRHSVFKEIPSVVLCAVLRLRKGNPAEIMRQMKKNLQFRIAHQPLASTSAGCAFKNVEIISSPRALTLTGEHSHFARFAHSAFLPAGFLIDKAGLKNYAIRGAKVSNRHANFIVTEGNASARDIIELIAHIKKQVYGAYGIALIEEIQLLKNIRKQK